MERSYNVVFTYCQSTTVLFHVRKKKYKIVEYNIYIYIYFYFWNTKLWRTNNLSVTLAAFTKPKR